MITNQLIGLAAMLALLFVLPAGNLSTAKVANKQRNK